MKINKITRLYTGGKRFSDDNIAKFLKSKLDLQIKKDSFEKNTQKCTSRGKK